MSYDFVTSVGDRGIDFVVSLKSDVSGTQTTVDLTTYSGVVFYMWPVGSTTMKIDGVAATISNAVNGEVTYAWQAADIDTSGSYRAKFVATNGEGEEVTFPREATGDADRYLTVMIIGEVDS